MSPEINNERFEALLGLLLDGELGRDEVAELVQLAAADRARVQEIQAQLEAAEMIALSEDELRDPALFASALEARIFEDPFVASVMSEVKRRPRWRSPLTWAPWGLAAAMLIAAVMVWGLPWEATVQANVAELVDVQGTIRWTGDDGQIDSAPIAGQQLTSGTLDTLGPDAWATLKFPDESSVTISGESSLSISAVKQKKQAIWNLRRGKLAGKVTVQPAGKPLLMYTPAAILQLPDADFQVTATTDRTALAVNRGRARVERLADKKTVDVPAAYRTVASVDAEAELRVEERGEPTSSWQANLQKEVSQGEWVDELSGLRKRLAAAIDAGRLTGEDAKRRFEAYASGLRLEGRDAGRLRAAPRPADGGVLHVVSLTLSPDLAAPVVLAEDSRIRVRGRVAQATGLVVGLTVGELGGAPRERAVAPPTRVEGDFNLILPISAFRARLGSLAGMELLSWLAFARGAEVDPELEITGVELLGPDETGSGAPPQTPPAAREGRQP